MNRSGLSRRGFTLGALAGTAVTAACSNGVGSGGGSVIDARVDTTLGSLYRTYPSTRNLADKANGMLVMPAVTEAGLGIGGGYGQGALRINETTVDYYSVTQISWGLQAGAQQYSHVLFFMTEQALANFRSASGWEASGQIEYVFADRGDGAAADTTTALAPVQAVVFGRAGLLLGATLNGAKYNRIIA